MMVKTAIIAGVLLGTVLGFPNSYVSQFNHRKESVLERRADDSDIMNRTSYVFQKLSQTGEHEYTGEINGKSFVYRFITEENRVELYLKKRK